jgi:hypothetical protein
LVLALEGKREMSNTALWDKLGKTDPSHTKTFKRAGGFSGTAIKPMWSYRRMTEEFGPCGKGWGINAPSFEVVKSEETTLVYCTVSVWYEKPDQTVFGVGGDMVAGKRGNYAMVDDEAFKKAYTDAVTNALKMIGVGADVHMGMFDDNKYVNTLQREFAEAAKADIPPPANDKPKSSASLKRDGTFERIRDQLAQDMLDVSTFAQFEVVKEHYRAEAKKNSWNSSFLFGLSELFGGYEAELAKKIEDENLLQQPLAAGE